LQGTNYGDLTYYQRVSNLRKGNYIVLNHKPCKIINIDETTNIKAVDIFTGNEIDRGFSKDDEINVPHFDVYEYDVLGLSQISSKKIILKHKDQVDEFVLPNNTEEQKKLSETIVDNLLNGRKQKICVIETMGIKQIFDYKLVK
jgi:translation elongation factor P/translation initiation factor 5A